MSERKPRASAPVEPVEAAEVVSNDTPIVLDNTDAKDAPEAAPQAVESQLGGFTLVTYL